MKSTVIECPECAGHGGEGVYCEDCLSTGRITVYGPPAEAIDQLRADLAAERQRAEAAEKDANELRSDNEMNAHYAARALHAEAERDQLLSHLADADQSSMERIAKIDALEAALAAVLPDFYREVCAEAERIIESSGMVSGAHWNAMKIILERRGVQPEVQP